MTATGIDIHGNKLFFNSTLDSIWCNNVNIHFIKLNIPERIKYVYCQNNKFNRNLILPENIKYCSCDKHALDNLNLYKNKGKILIFY